MAVKYSAGNTLTELECSVCSDPITDPRPLVCGHSFCGPPRRCLFLLEHKPNVLTCAICRNDQNSKPTDIKPLYGIREFFNSQERITKENESQKNCNLHQKQYTLWCSTCKVMICEDCFENNHDGHLVRKMKKYLEEEYQKFLKMDLIEGLNKFQAHLEDTQKTVSIRLHYRKNEVTKLQMLTKNASQLRDKINFYLISKSAPNQSNSSVCETDLLIDIHHLLKPEMMSNFLESASCQTESSPREDKCAQTVSVEQVTAEAQTRTDGFQKDAKNAQTLILWGIDHIEEVFPWCSYILSMNIENRNPLKVKNSATMDVIQKYKVWLSVHAARCPKHIYHKSCPEKLLRVTIHCDYKNWVDEVLPTKLELSLEIILYGLKAQINITKSGTLVFPRTKNVDVDLLLYNQFVQHSNEWIGPGEKMNVLFSHRAISTTRK